MESSIMLTIKYRSKLVANIIPTFILCANILFVRYMGDDQVDDQGRDLLSYENFLSMMLVWYSYRTLETLFLLNHYNSTINQIATGCGDGVCNQNRYQTSDDDDNNNGEYSVTPATPDDSDTDEEYVPSLSTSKLPSQIPEDDDEPKEQTPLQRALNAQRSRLLTRSSSANPDEPRVYFYMRRDRN